MLKLIVRMKRLYQIIFTIILAIQSHASRVYACGSDEIETAIGCISTKADASGGFFSSIIRIAVGLGGGLALVLMLYGVFIVTTSAGIPDKLKEGGEIITSAVAGLVFVLLSVFLLNLIGINILGLPGLA